MLVKTKTLTNWQASTILKHQVQVAHKMFNKILSTSDVIQVSEVNHSNILVPQKGHRKTALRYKLVHASGCKQKYLDLSTPHGKVGHYKRVFSNKKFSQENLKTTNNPADNGYSLKF